MREKDKKRDQLMEIEKKKNKQKDVRLTKTRNLYASFSKK